MAKPAVVDPSSEDDSRKMWKHKGYPKLGEILGAHQDLAIFRRFGFLTMISLMSLQAELVDLEQQLRSTYEEDDASSDPKRNCLSEDFYATREAKSPNDRQEKLLIEVRVKLKDYHKLLLRAAGIAQFERPSKYNLQTLRDWLVHEDGGSSFLQGLELDNTWDEALQPDMVALVSEDSEDAPLVKWLSPNLIDWYHRLGAGRRKTESKVKPQDSGLVDYRGSFFVRSSNLITVLVATILASLFPVLAILILYFVQEMIARIYITIGLTAGLGLLLKLCTNANMKEIFGATAAFAAVEVVFIGSANGQS